jgi:hypothetical protein
LLFKIKRGEKTSHVSLILHCDCIVFFSKKYNKYMTKDKLKTIF